MIYTPAEDSYLLKSEVIKYAVGKKVLDIGSGSGIQAKAALLAGAKSVLAADISEEAISNLSKDGIRAVKSDLFSNVKGNFSLIIFNPPYLPYEKKEDYESSLATSGGEKGDELIIRFIEAAGEHLARRGIILIVLSSLTPKKRILECIRKHSMYYEVLSSKSLFMEELEVWKISPINLKPDFSH
ncbi:MAG: HemK2/MTQ2 family protein methyltransferase [Nanoarchaeota archaeon]